MSSAAPASAPAVSETSAATSVSAGTDAQTAEAKSVSREEVRRRQQQSSKNLFKEMREILMENSLALQMQMQDSVPSGDKEGGHLEGALGPTSGTSAADGEHRVDISPDDALPKGALDGLAIMYGAEVDSFWVATSSIMLCITYSLVFTVAGIVCWQFTMYQYESHVIAWTIGAVFMLMAVPLTLQDIHFHIIHYCSPLQRHYIRILWMIPIYSVESWLALRFNKQKLYLETMREAYEAYVVYSFFKLMREFLGDKKTALARLKRIQAKRGNMKTTVWETPGACCCMAWRLDAQFLTRSALGVYQYVVLRTLCAVIGLILEQWHLFGEGHYNWNQFYVYYVMIVNLSQCWALWCLLVFYQIMKHDLGPLRPLPKFLVIKAVVFVSWWQGIIIMYMASQEMLHPVLDYSSEDVAKGLQNLLICAEMLVYGVCFHYCFRYSDFKNDGALMEWLSENKAVMKKPEEALNEMMPIDVLQEGKGYVERVPRYVANNLIPDAIKDSVKDLPENLSKNLSKMPGMPHMPSLPDALLMGRSRSVEQQDTEASTTSHKLAYEQEDKEAHEQGEHEAKGREAVEGQGDNGKGESGRETEEREEAKG
jgi:hypothetical protein